MSHFTTLRTQFRDIEAVKAACEELGLSVVANGAARGWNGNTRKGQFVIRLKGPYDVAVNMQKDGTLAMDTDWYAGHVEKELGLEFKKLTQLYAVHKVTIEARKRGQIVKRHAPNAAGKIKLVITGI